MKAQRGLALAACLLCWQLPAAAQSGSTLSLQVDRGLLSAQIENAPLASVLEELHRQTGTAVRLIDPAAANVPIWVSFEDLPLDQGIRRLVHDVSYVYFAQPAQRVVYVLSSNPSWQPGGVRASSSAAAAATDDAEANAASIREATRQLNSTDSSAQLIAVNQLTGMHEPSAVETLRNVAAGTAATNEARVLAASALAQTALATPNEESPELQALRQLTADRNPNVRAVAQQTLQDIEMQRREIDLVSRQDGAVDKSKELQGARVPDA